VPSPAQSEALGVLIPVAPFTLVPRRRVLTATSSSLNRFHWPFAWSGESLVAATLVRIESGSSSRPTRRAFTHKTTLSPWNFSLFGTGRKHYNNSEDPLTERYGLMARARMSAVARTESASNPLGWTVPSRKNTRKSPFSLNNCGRSLSFRIGLPKGRIGFGQNNRSKPRKILRRQSNLSSLYANVPVYRFW